MMNRQLARAKDTEDILKLVAESHEEMSPVNIATANHRLAVINKRKRASRDRLLRDKRFALLEDAIEANAADFGARSVADMLWSSATLQHWPPRLLKPVLTGVATQLSANTFEAQHLSTMTWALAKLTTKPTRLLEQFEEQALTKLDGLNMQNCANLLWGFATLRYQPREELALLPKLAASMLARGIVADAKPVEVSDLMSALARLCTPEQLPRDLFLALAARAAPDAENSVLERFSSRQLVVLASATATLGVAEQLPEGLLDAWLARVRTAHQATPLLVGDAKELETTLGVLGLDATWVQRSEMLNVWTDLAAGGAVRAKRSYTDEELRAAFDAIDTDGSGDIDQAELLAAFREVNPEAASADVEQMLDFGDADGDREVSFDEFKQIMNTAKVKAKATQAA